MTVVIPPMVVPITPIMPTMIVPVLRHLRPFRLRAGPLGRDSVLCEVFKLFYRDLRTSYPLAES